MKSAVLFVCYRSFELFHFDLLMEGARCGSYDKVHRYGANKSDKILGDRYLGKYLIYSYVDLGKYRMHQTENCTKCNTDEDIKERAGDFLKEVPHTPQEL